MGILLILFAVVVAVFVLENSWPYVVKLLFLFIIGMSMGEGLRYLDEAKEARNARIEAKEEMLEQYRIISMAKEMHEEKQARNLYENVLIK